MNKQDLKYAYLNYFKNQFANNEPIESKTLLQMASNGEIAIEVISELVQDGLVDGIYFVDGDEKSLSLDLNEVVKLTEKGKSEINRMIFTQKLAENHKKEDQNEKFIQSILIKEKDRISNLSKIEKEKESKVNILKYFKFLNFEIDKYENGQITDKELKKHIKEIVATYFDRVPQIQAQKITEKLLSEGYITYLYQKNSTGLVDIDKLLTNKAKIFLDKLEKEKKEAIREYCKEHNIKFPQIDIPRGLMQAYQSIYNNPTIIQQAIKQSSILAKYMNTLQNLDYNNIQMAIEAASNIPSNIAFNYIPQNKKDNINDDINKTYTFEGILGQNCGDYITINNYNKDDRLPERIINEKTGQHFIVKNGIKVLRGFAKASDLYLASEPDKKNYQRNEDGIHLEELSNFIDEMNPSGKYLPELTFIARGGYELHRPEWSKKLQTTQLGYFKNTNYYQLHLNGTKLYRIDGNHRLEAMQRLTAKNNNEYYIPFAIVLMGKQVLFEDADQIESSLGLEFSGNYGLADDKDEKKIVDMEAFLFYFLNAKAKRLTTEENYRGLISSNWEEHEIMIANKNIILLQHLEKIIKEDILHNDFCDNEPLKQISEILDNINENIELKKFKKIIKIMNNLLAKNCWNNLKKFNFYCQLIFYVSFKHGEEAKCEQILNNLEHWVQKYDFDNTTFDNPILLYNNAKKTNNIDPINIFVAMPFDKSNIDNFTEWIETAIKNIETENSKYKNRLKLYKIMTHRGYTIDLMDDIMDKISNCSIFIAEISPCKITINDKEIICDANPNVMYELGIASNLKKPIILMRESLKFPNVPSDIQEKYRNTYSRTNAKDSRESLQKSIKAVIEDYYDQTSSI